MTDKTPAHTITVIVADFIMDRQVRGLAANTVRYYQDELLLMRYAAEHSLTVMDELTPNVIRAFLTDLALRRNIGGVHSVYRSVKAFCNWWEEETDGQWHNPINKVKISTPKSKPLPGVPVADIQRMVDACTTALAQRDSTMLRMLLDTGARAFKFLALTVSDVEMDTGAVHIQRGKGDKERTVYIGKICRRELRRYLRTRSNPKPDAPLWLTDDGDPLTKRGLMSMVDRRATSAGVPVPGLHDFRRAFALNMWRNGADILTISRLMGHTTLAVTQRYIAEFDEDLRAGHLEFGPVDHA